MSTGLADTNMDWQNFYVGHLTADITGTATDIFLDTVPTVSESMLVIDPDTPASSEVIFFNAKTATKVSCPANGRGYDGSTAIAHLTGTKVILAPVGDMFRYIRTLATTTPQGWTAVASAPNTVVANGNRSYTCTFNAVDYSATLSPGMRLRTTRTVAAPTQSTSLNGTTQYYSKASPAGMTFTVTCTAMGARKLNAYSAQWFGGRTTGTNGFRYGVNASGQLIFEVQPGNATTKTVTSYQSVSLSKWFRYAFQIDLAGTCQIMLDGVAIPSTTAGTATSLTQAVADFQLGAAGGAGFTNGKMAQDAIFSAKLADATVLSYEGQSFAGTETSLISAYSFNNTINDLNANANNLTANGSAVATNADSPFGGQAGGTISSTLDYGIIQSVAFSTNTTVVVQVPEGCTIPTSGGVSAVSYATVKSPYGFPAQRGKWRVKLLSKYNGAQSPATANTWYNVGSVQLNVPIGEWSIKYSASVLVTNNSAAVSGYSTLSTGAATESDIEMTQRAISLSSGSNTLSAGVYRDRDISLSTATPYYLNHKCDTGTGTNGIQISNQGEPSIIEVENALL